MAVCGVLQTVVQDLVKKRPADKEALEALDDALRQILAAVGPEAKAVVVRRVRTGLAKHADALELARAATDPVKMPRATFDPSHPATVGRMVSLALVAQGKVPLTDVPLGYGSGVYAIYYEGEHPLYRGISGTETPIYVGKADPAHGDARSPREQGDKLSRRLHEHATTIRTAEEYAAQHNLPDGLHPIALSDFSCRKLVCATNAQLAAERHLIGLFWPIWNSDTKACWGMSKHGDAAGTRKNKRSPWDVVHPGRKWALDAELEDNAGPQEIMSRIGRVLERVPPRLDHAALLEEMLIAFRQDADTQADESSPPLPDVAGPDAEEAGQDD